MSGPLAKMWPRASWAQLEMKRSTVSLRAASAQLGRGSGATFWPGAQTLGSMPPLDVYTVGIRPGVRQCGDCGLGINIVVAAPEMGPRGSLGRKSETAVSKLPRQFHFSYLEPRGPVGPSRVCVAGGAGGSAHVGLGGVAFVLAGPDHLV